VLILLASASGRGQDASRIPSQLSDAAFWELVSTLSEPDGFSEDENYVSNELGYQHLMPQLQEAVPPGGVFIGAGPEQNFAYVAATQPAIAFVVDIRRQNLVQHLMYKALFELSSDRADFLSRLFSRPRPAGLGAETSVGALFDTYAGVSPDAALFDATLDAMLDLLVSTRRFALDDEDRTVLRKVFTAFRDSGPELRYVFRGTPELHPTYAQMMTAADAAGRSWSYLASADTFERVRRMQARHLIVPVVGDFAGPTALRAIGDWIRARNAQVDLFYTSNVEPYLFGSGRADVFYENLAAMPLAPDGIFVRSFFGSTARECAILRPTIRTPVAGPIGPVMAAFRSGGLASQCELVVLTR
jgi:hypothetical protein